MRRSSDDYRVETCVASRMLRNQEMAGVRPQRQASSNESH